MTNYNYLAEAIKNWFGQRCEEFAEGCFTCEAWQQYDRMKKTSISKRKAKSMKIGIDIDDVVTNTMGSFVSFHNRVYQTDYKYEDLHVWNLNSIFPEINDKEDIRDMFKFFTHTGEFRDVEEVEGARETILQLIEDGHELYFVSARNSNGISDTYRWFASRGLPIERLFFDTDKKWHTDFHGFDVFIDDGIHNLKKLKNKNNHTVLFDRPWNVKEKSPLVDKRAKNWNEVYKYIKELENEKK